MQYILKDRGSHIQIANMAQRKETPKKVYAKSNLDSKSMCRLCCSIIDPKHCKNLYNKASVNVLASAELLYGGKLLRGDSLPHLVCRPCERRLDNFMKFKNMICDNQDSMMRQKRCIELSPSAPTADEKSAKTDTLIRGKSSQSRRSLSSSFETYDLPLEPTLPKVYAIF